MMRRGEGGGPAFRRTNVFKNIILFAPTDETGDSHGVFATVKNYNELFTTFVGKRLENESVDCAEDGCIRPDAQREREHGHGGEAGVLQQLSKGKANVVHRGDRR